MCFFRGSLHWQRTHTCPNPLVTLQRDTLVMKMVVQNSSSSDGPIEAVYSIGDRSEGHVDGEARGLFILARCTPHMMEDHGVSHLLYFVGKGADPRTVREPVREAWKTGAGPRTVRQPSYSGQVAFSCPGVHFHRAEALLPAASSAQVGVKRKLLGTTLQFAERSVARHEPLSFVARASWYMALFVPWIFWLFFSLGLLCCTPERPHLGVWQRPGSNMSW